MNRKGAIVADTARSTPKVSVFDYHAYSPDVYLLLALILAPYFWHTNGMTISTCVQNPSNGFAHPTPRPSYICTANSGKMNAKRYLRNVSLAQAEASYNAP